MSGNRQSLRAAGWIIFFSATAIAVIAGSVAIAGKLSSNDSGGTNPACHGSRQNHVVIIKGNAARPEHTVGQRCDTLTITNEDNTNRLMAFGLHEHHTPYDGVTERLLAKGQSLKVTLVQTGNFRFHDHLHDEVQGTFTVNN